VLNQTDFRCGQQVRDVPLLIADEKHALKWIRGVEIIACEPSGPKVGANPSQKFYGFEWKVTLNDGRTFPWPYSSNLSEKPPNLPTQGLKEK